MILKWSKLINFEIYFQRSLKLMCNYYFLDSSFYGLYNNPKIFAEIFIMFLFTERHNVL